MTQFNEMKKAIIEHLNSVQYEHGDTSDIGNEIGYAIGKWLDHDNKDAFIIGLNHGISLIDGTHF
jgi:hypothetical protein